MTFIKAVLFGLGNTIIAEVDESADIDTVNFELIVGAEEVLENLCQKYRLAIVSNTLTWGDKEIMRALDRKKIGKCFDAVVTSVTAGSWKPDGDIFEKVLKRLDCRADEAVMVGDRLDTDISGANEMGITSILCRTIDKYAVTKAGIDFLPDYIIGSLKELPTLLDGLYKAE